MGPFKGFTFLITLGLIFLTHYAIAQVRILSNQIGIGTNTPETALDIRSASNLESASLRVGTQGSKIQLLSGYRDNERSYVLFSPQDTFLFARQFNTDTTEVMRLTPAGAMEVQGPISARGPFDLRRSATDFSVYIGAGTGTSTTNFSFDNVFIGRFSGRDNQTGSRNTFVGRGTGSSNGSGSFNTFVGFDSGTANTIGVDNTGLGTMSGQSNTSGSSNVFLGAMSGQSNTSGSSNVFLGNQAGNGNTGGNTNIFIGRFSGSGSQTGSLNTYIGNAAGPLNFPGTQDGSIAIGNNAKVDCSYCAVIGGTDEFAVDLGLGVPVPTAKLDVNGTVRIRDLPIGSGNFIVADNDGNLFISSGNTFRNTGNTSELMAENQALRTELEAVKSRLHQLETMVRKLAALEETSSPEYQQSATLTDARLEQNHPNPFQASTQIRYFIPESVNQAVLTISNARGELVKSIEIDHKGQGQTTLQTAALSAGTYFYSLILDGNVLETKKMVVAH